MQWLFALSGLLAFGSAQAATQTQVISIPTVSWQGATYDVNGNLISSGNYSQYSGTFSYNKFNPALGTLTGADICVSVTGTGNSMSDYYNWAGVTNLPTISVSRQQGIGFSISGGDCFLDSSYVPLYSAVQATGAQNFTTSTNAAYGTWKSSPGQYSSAALNYSNSLNAPHLSHFQGTGTNSFSVDAWIQGSNSYSPTPPGGSDVTADRAVNTHWESQSWTMTVTIRYYYTGLCNMSGLSLSGTGTCNNNGTPADTTDDYYLRNVTVNYTNKPSSGTLDLSGSGIHSGSYSVAVGTAGAGSYTFSNVKINANGSAPSITATFSAEPACTASASGPAISACSIPPCSMTGITAGSGSCNNNGTPNDTSDDFYLSVVAVTFSNRPSSGTLSLTGGAIHSGSYSVNASSTGTTSSHTFPNVKLKANGNANDLTASFSADPACTITTTNTSVSTCSFPCSMSGVSASIGTCYDNGTPSVSSDDYHLSTVTVSFSNKPTSGTLSLSGLALHPDNSASTSVGVASTTTATSHIFSGVWLKANGTANALTATFSADPSCTATTTGTSRPSCSIPPCSMTGLTASTGSCNTNATPTNITDDYYLSSVTVSFTSRPSSGTLSLNGTAIHSGSYTVNAVSTATSTSHTFTNVKLKANGTANDLTAVFSADPSCTFTISAPVVVTCSAPPSCAVTGLTVSQGSCDNNGTPADTSDDSFPATVTVTFSSPPGSGNLSLSGPAIHSGSYSVAATSTTTGTSHVFSNVFLKANGTANALTATFSADPACTLSTSATAKAHCSFPPCEITSLNPTTGACNNNGTPPNSSDDYYLSNVTITFDNRPTSGMLSISGAAIHASNSAGTSVSAVSTSTSTSHTFTGLWLKANGLANGLTAVFSADPSCSLTSSAPAVASCSNPACSISSVSPSFGTCNANGTPANMADDYYLSNVTVSFSNRPSNGTLDLSGAAIHAGNTGNLSVNATATSTGTSHTFTGIWLKANGTANALTAAFSNGPACTLTTTNTSVATCSSGTCPTITIASPTVLSNGMPGLPYGPVNFNATGGVSPYTWSVSPPLPTGLTFTSAGVLSGTPAAASSGSYVFTAQDSTSGLVCTASSTLTLFVGCPVVTIIPPGPYPDCAVGQPYPSQQFVVSGGNGPFTWSMSPPIDALTINSATGLLSGTITSAGSFTSTITVTDANGCFGTTLFTTVNSACPEDQILNPGQTYTMTVESGIVSAMWLRNLGSGPIPIPGATSLSYLVNTPGAYSWIGIDGDGCVVESCCAIEFKSPTSVSIGNLVWEDCDNDGIKDPSEPGLEGAQVRLFNPGNDNAIGGSGANADVQVGTSITTDSTGSYRFDDLSPGRYFVRVTPPGTNWKTAPPVVTADNGIDNDNNGAQPAGTGSVLNSPVVLLGIATEPILEDGDASTDLTIDFGIWPGYKVGDLVFEDENNDGIRQPSEPPVSGLTIAIINAGADQAIGGTGLNADVSLTTTTTSATGTFCFNLPLSGYFYLRLTPNLTYPIPSSVAFPDNGINNDNNGTQPAGNGTPVFSPVFRLQPCMEPGTAGTTNQELTLDFGMRLGALGIGNLVFEDLNNNEIADPGEGISGTRIRIYGAGKIPGTDPFISEQTTSANGKFLFTYLLAGQYFLHIPASEFQTSRPLNGLFSLPGFRVGDDNGGDSVAADPLSPHLTGMSTGNITLSKGGQPTDAGFETGIDYTEDNSSPYQDNYIDLTQDVGLYRRVSMGNLVFYDANSNNRADDGEGVSNVTVQLYTTAQTPGVSTPIATTTTDANGRYLLHAFPGAYRLFIPPAMFQSGAPLAGYLSIANGQFGDDNVGEDGLNQANPAVTGIATATISAFPGIMPTAGNGETGFDSASDDILDSAIDLTIDFGFQRPITLGNLVFYDANSNGRADTGEGVAGVTVQLYENGATPGQSSPLRITSTDSAGHYLFTGISPATYFIHIPAANFAASGPLAGKVSMTGSEPSPTSDDRVGENGANGTSPVLNGVSSIAAQYTAGALPTDSGTSSTSGENGYLATEDNARDSDGDLTIDFGFTLPDPNNVGVGNLVFADLDGDNIADPGEGIDNVSVRLYQATQTNPNDFNYYATTTTSGGGGYFFSNLPPGAYYVQIPAINWIPAITVLGVTIVPAGPLFGRLPIPGQDVAGDVASARYDDDQNENGDDTLPSTPGFSGIRSTNFTLTADQEPNDFDTEFGSNALMDADDDDNADLTVDFGFYTPVGVGNLVFTDLNGNGVANSGEGVGGVVVELWSELDPFAPVATQTTSTVTSSKGRFHFTNLRPGTYYLRIPPSEFNAPSNGVGGHLIGRVSMDGAQISGDDNLGEDGIDNVEPHLSGIRTADFTLTPGAEPYGAQEAGLFANIDDGATLGDRNHDLTQDIGFIATVCVGNLVFKDMNLDGKYTAGTDMTMDGVTVELYSQPPGNQPSSLTATAQTADGGKYSFCVPPGSYFIRLPASNFTPFTGILAGTRAALASANAFDDDLDQDAIADGDPTVNGVKTATFTLGVGTEPTNAQGETGTAATTDDAMDADSDLTIDLGLEPLPLSVGNLVFKDLNNTGKYEAANDTPLVGVKIRLYASGSLPGADPIAAEVTTGADGTYLLTAYQEGEYFAYIPASEFAASKPLNGLTSVTGYSGTVVDDHNTGQDNGIDNANPAANGIYSSPLSLYYYTMPVGPTGGPEAGHLANSDDSGMDNHTDLTIDFGFKSAAPAGSRVTTTLASTDSTGASSVISSSDSGDQTESTSYPATFIQWQQLHASATNELTAEDNPDADLYPNLIEYALGLAPANRASQPTQPNFRVVAEAADPSQAQLSLTRPSSGHLDLRYHLETADAPSGQWVEQPLTSLVTTQNNDGTETWSLALAWPNPSTSGKPKPNLLAARLRVSLDADQNGIAEAIATSPIWIAHRHTFPIAQTTLAVPLMPPDSSSLIEGKAPAWKLEQLLPPAAFRASNSAATADTVHLLAGSGYLTHWLYQPAASSDAKPQPARWVAKASVSFANTGSTAVTANTGLIVQPRTQAISRLIIGILPPVPMSPTLPAGSTQLIGSGSLEAMPATQLPLHPGTSIANAPNLRLWNPDVDVSAKPGTTIYHLLNSPNAAWQPASPASPPLPDLQPFQAYFITVP